ncbi:MAG: hypothetical protein EKK55_06670 [Rhodocyclaceae bacterium]|nr:MAG: hypothetical protein EKK55_06670 [Rhodocyclaceae bacterium]
MPWVNDDAGPYAGCTLRAVSRIGDPADAGGEHLHVEVVDGAAAGYRFRMPMAHVVEAGRVEAMAAPNYTEEFVRGRQRC